MTILIVRLHPRLVPRNDSTNREIAGLISYSRNDRESSILQSQIYTRPERSFSARFVIS